MDKYWMEQNRKYLIQKRKILITREKRKKLLVLTPGIWLVPIRIRHLFDLQEGPIFCDFNNYNHTASLIRETLVKSKLFQRDYGKDNCFP
jgi:hypothetical protein